MRSLKFTSDLVPLIISGEKTSTWRLFDDKYIETGDVIEFVNSETKESFGKAEITWVSLKPLNALGEEDYVGHERPESLEKLVESFKVYYGDKVTPDTVAKVIHFRFILPEASLK